MEEKSKLEKLKEKYSVLEKENSLPSFKELNEEFSIERISDNETDFILREVRRQIAEKLSSALRLIDVLINPSNTPTFLFPVIKSITKEEKEIMEKLYKELSKIEISNLKLDLVYSPEEDVKYIKNSFSYWKEIKPTISKVFSCIEQNLDKKSEKTNSCYFG